MSERKTKMARKAGDDIALVTEEADPKAVAEEQAKAIRKMIEDRDKKMMSAKERLVSQLRVTVDKYRTANGVMSALSTVREVRGTGSYIDLTEEIDIAKGVATKMAQVTSDLADKAESLEPESLDMLCEGVYDAEFSQGEHGPHELVEQLMILQLCQNVGPSAEDVVEFAKRADEEIDKAREELKVHCEKNGIDFLELCGE